MMDTISSTLWQRQGFCIAFDGKSLGPFIAQGALVSLREALAWMRGFPDTPPVPAGRAILICGLETVLETLPLNETEDFLARRIRPLLLEVQNRWTGAYSVIFGFSSHERAFEETSLEEAVLFIRRDRKIVRLSEGLWGNSTTADMKRVAREGEKQGEAITVGYYVARIS